MEIYKIKLKNKTYIGLNTLINLQNGEQQH